MEGRDAAAELVLHQETLLLLPSPLLRDQIYVVYTVSADPTTGDLGMGRLQINGPIQNDVFYFCVLKTAPMARWKGITRGQSHLLLAACYRKDFCLVSVVKSAPAI